MFFYFCSLSGLFFFRKRKFFSCLRIKFAFILSNFALENGKEQFLRLKQGNLGSPGVCARLKIMRTWFDSTRSIPHAVY